PRPGAEVLRRDVAAGGLAQVRVDVVRRDRLASALRIEILEQLVARQVLALLHDASEPPVGDRDGVVDAALAAESELELRALDLDVAAAERGETERAVRLRVLVVADADQRLVEQAHHGREDLAPRQVARAQVALDALADLRKDLAELEHAAELRPVARVAVQRVIAVLLASARVARGDLDVALRVRADPHLGPRRRHHERREALELLALGDALAVGPAIAPARARALAADPGDAVADVGQPRARRGLAVLVDARRQRRVAQLRAPRRDRRRLRRLLGTGSHDGASLCRAGSAGNVRPPPGPTNITARRAI